MSPISVLNHWPISWKLSLFQPVEAPELAATGAMAKVAGLYWNTAVNHDAWVIVMVEKQAELVTGAGSGEPPDRMRLIASAHTLASWLAIWPALGWVVALADMPFIAPASHQAVAASLRAGASLAACAFEGRRGHPVGFAGTWFEQLASLTGDQGGKPILQAHRQGLVLCPVDDPGVLRDIDRVEDVIVG